MTSIKLMFDLRCHIKLGLRIATFMLVLIILTRPFSITLLNWCMQAKKYIYLYEKKNLNEMLQKIIFYSNASVFWSWKKKGGFQKISCVFAIYVRNRHTIFRTFPRWTTKANPYFSRKRWRFQESLLACLTFLLLATFSF